MVAMTEKVNVSLDADAFRAFIQQRRKSYMDHGSYAHVIVLGSELEDLITNLFFQGKLSDLVSYNTDRHGKIRMYLDGVKVMFTDNLDLFHSFWVLDGHPLKLPDGTVTPTTGPGRPPDGGTPIALAKAA